MVEGEAGEAAGDWCQSMTGVGPPRFPHQPGVQPGLDLHKASQPSEGKE